MAPLPVNDVYSLKRNAITADLDLPAAKRQHLRPARHHKLPWAPNEAIRYQSSPQSEESAQLLLTRSIALALEAVGFESADPVAIESFRAETEEYILRFLASVRQSMLHCRRTQPIPHDFLQSLHEHRLSLRSLLPHLDPPVPPTKSQISLALEPQSTEQQQQLSAVNLFINDNSQAGTRHYIPKVFPAFPSQHTYKATPDVSTRDHDPRKVRERATEEGRLGEAALRRLVSSRADENLAVNAQNPRAEKSMRARRDMAWKEAMDAVETGPDLDEAASQSSQDLQHVTKEAREGLPFRSRAYVSTDVNADKKYWRKPALSTTARVHEGKSAVQ